MSRAKLVPLVFLALATPVGVSFATRALADTVGRDLGRALASALTALRPHDREPAQRTRTPVLLPFTEPAPRAEALPPEEIVRTGAPLKAGKHARTLHARNPRPSAPLGVRVGSHKVLELAERRAIPSARPVPAQGSRPAGLELHGVGGLGVGMRDGDILTSVAGVPVTSVGAIAELVLRARARRASEISAQFWRDGAPGNLVVEQPYLAENKNENP